MDASQITPPSGNKAGSSASTAFLSKLGLHRKELRAWALYDLANSAFITIILTSVFPIYFAKVASAGIPSEQAEFRFVIASSIGMILIAGLSPFLGALADFFPIKKRMIGIFLSLGVLSTSLMFFIQHGNWFLALILFLLATIGANGSFVFYDALLPHLAQDEELDRVSTAGYALGYIGGGLLLALNLLWIQKPGWFGLPSGENLTLSQETLPTRLAFLSVALWWVLFSIPLFRSVPEPPLPLSESKQTSTAPFKAAWARLQETFSELTKYRNAFLMLIAFLVYNDGIGTIIRMAAIYASGLGIDSGHLISAILITQFVGVPFAFLFGMLASRLGAKKCIFLSLLVYTGISIVGYFMKTAGHFLVLAILVGMVQGGAQALSRSLFASLIPRHKSGEFFGFFAVVEKFAGIFGPLLFGVMIALSGSSRNAILSVIAFFVIGAILLYFVNVEEGQRIAREAEQNAEQKSASGS